MELLDLLESLDGLIPLDHPRLHEVNLSRLLGITKWEKPLTAQLAGMAEGYFPSFIRKTDQERCQNLVPEIFGFEDQIIPANEELGRPEIVRLAKGDRNAQYEVTMKLDGSSMTVFARHQYADGFVDEEGQFQDPIQSGVCSRNLQLKINEANAENTFVKMAVDTGLLRILEQIVRDTAMELAVQGELMGPNIQENREGLNDYELYVYDIYDITTSSYLPASERNDVMNRMYNMGMTARVKHVPIIAHAANLYDTLGITNVTQLLNFAEGPSIKHPIREGLVFKRLDGQFSFKAISNKYLAKEKD